MGTKLAEHLVILNDFGEGLLTRAYNNVRFEGIKNVEGELDRFLKKMGETFPKLPDKLVKDKGNELFTKRATELSTTLYGYYYTFLDIIQFKTKAFEVSKALISAYSRAHQIVSGNSEGHLTDIVQYLAAYAKPLEALRNEFEPVVSPFVGAALLQVLQPLTQYREKTFYIKQSIFNVVDRSEDLVSHKNENHHKLLLLLSRMREWTIWGYLVCPAELANDAAVNVLPLALGETFVVSLHRDEVLQIHEELETLFDDYQIKKIKFKLSKHKKVLKDAINDYEKTLQGHHDMRRYLCAELSSVTALFRLAPATAAPKLYLALSLMRLARDEVLWYALHYHCKPFRAASRFVVPRDRGAIELLHKCIQLADTLRTTKPGIEPYYRECLVEDANNFLSAKEVFVKTANVSPSIQQLLEMIALVLSDSNAVKSFEPFRLNVLRVFAGIQSAHSGVPAAAAAPLVTILSNATSHSQAIDSLERLLEAHGSFKGLNWFQSVIATEIMATCVPGHAVGAYSIVRALANATQNVCGVCPEELQPIGESAVRFVDAGIRRLVATVIDWLTELIADARALRATLQPMAAWRRMASRDAAGPMPGAESQMDGRASHNTLLALIEAVGDLGSALARADSLVVYEYEFSPREYLTNGLQSLMRQQMRKLCVRGTNEIQRPTIVCEGLRTLIASFDLLDRRVALGMGEMVRTVLQTELAGVYQLAGGEEVGATNGLPQPVIGAPSVLGTVSGPGATLAASGSVSSITSASGSGAAATGAISIMALPSDDKTQLRDPILQTICKWYSWLLSQELDTMAITYNQQRQCFEGRPYVNERGANVRPSVDAEGFTDRNELRALATLLGPRGVAELNKQLIIEIQKLSEKLFSTITLNSALIQQVRGHFTETQLWLNTSEQMQHKEEFLAASVIIGCCLKFRSLLQAALREVTANAAPAVVNAVDQALAAELAAGGMAMLATSPLTTLTGSICMSANVPVINAASAAAASSAQSAAAAASQQGSAAATRAARLSELKRLSDLCGTAFEGDDVALRDALRRFKTSGNDAAIWSLLPEAYSLCLSAAPWLNSKYDIASEAHDNNVHMLCIAVRELITCFGQLPSQQNRYRVDAPEDSFLAVRRELQRFVECAAHSLLNINSTKDKEKGSKASVPPNVMVFLEHFIEACPAHLRMSMLEECFPYTLLRTNYIQMYEKQSKTYNVMEEEKE